MMWFLPYDANKWAFFLTLINVKETWYNYDINYYIVYLIISIGPWCITTSSFQGEVEVINKKVGKIIWVFQDAILINYHTFACMLFII